MGQITISKAGLTGTHTIADTKITNVLRLFGLATIENFAGMTNQQKADAVAEKLYEHARMIAWQEKRKELAATRSAEDEAALAEL